MPREYPSMPVVGVGCIVFREGEVLLVKRGRPPAEGRWSLPGGHVGLGEDLVEAARRELLEETGVRAEPVGVVNVDSLIALDPEGRVKYHYVLVDVLFRDPVGEPVAGSDALEAGYFPVEEALEMPLTPSTMGAIIKAVKGELPMERPIKHRVYTL